MDLKTPISLLQEYLVKDGILPSYQLIQCQTGTHEPTFGFEVKAKGLTGTGKGRSKKEAKQEAAKSLLLQLKGETIWRNEIPIISPHVQSVKGNSIGSLQEYCVQHTLSIPQYELVSDEGNLTSHMFVVRCTVSSFSAEGKASTKQQAKHLAAQAMLNKLQNVKEEVIDMSLNIVKEKKELSDKARSKTIEAFHKSLHEREDRPITSTNNMKNLLNFADYLRNKIGSNSLTLASLKNLDEKQVESLEDPEDLLKLILNQLGFPIKLEFLDSKDSSYTLCNLFVGKVCINFIGAAKSKNDAKKQAAINTLKVLVIMSKV